MSDSDDDEIDPTSFFLHELRNIKPWDASQIEKDGEITLKTLKSTDFSQLPERVAFYEKVLKKYPWDFRQSLEDKRSAEWRKTGFWMPVTVLCAIPNVQVYYKIMYLTQKKIEATILKLLNGGDVTTDELLQPVFSWILGSFNRPLPEKFKRRFDPDLFKQNSLKENVAHGGGNYKHFEFLDDLLGYALGLQARTTDVYKLRQNPVFTLHEILDIWSEDVDEEERSAKEQRAKAKQSAKEQRAKAKERVSKKPEQHKPEVPKVPTVPDSWEDAAWDEDDPSDELKKMKVRAAVARLLGQLKLCSDVHSTKLETGPDRGRMMHIYVQMFETEGFESDKNDRFLSVKHLQFGAEDSVFDLLTENMAPFAVWVEVFSLGGHASYESIPDTEDDEVLFWHFQDPDNARDLLDKWGRSLFQRERPGRVVVKLWRSKPGSRQTRQDF